MGGMTGSDAARRAFEDAITPGDTETASAALLTTAGANLGDPLDYGAYLIGQLTGSWADVNGVATYTSNDQAHPLPDFNLDADRGYAYQCWDYLRHASSVPPAPRDALDMLSPDQWGCAPQLITILSEIQGRTAEAMAADIRDWYGYPEPCTVPQRYDPRDNPHHRSRYDPLKRLAFGYRPRMGQDPAPGQPPIPPLGCDGIDLQVSEAEMRDAGMSTTGRRPVP